MRRSRPISDHDDESRKLLAACRVTDGAALTLKRWPTDTTVPGLDKQGGTRALAIATRATAALQGRLVAERLWGVLLILQSMDAGGKDSTVRNVCRGIDPGGLRVTSFKAPSRDEMGQDFLRRSHQDLPARGQIGVFNRS
jgi:polyphosphate kinase 2 (PPK2 family)